MPSEGSMIVIPPQLIQWNPPPLNYISYNYPIMRRPKDVGTDETTLVKNKDFTPFGMGVISPVSHNRIMQYLR